MIAIKTHVAFSLFILRLLVGFVKGSGDCVVYEESPRSDFLRYFMILLESVKRLAGNEEEQKQRTRQSLPKPPRHR